MNMPAPLEMVLAHQMDCTTRQGHEPQFEECWAQQILGTRDSWEGGGGPEFWGGSPKVYAPRSWGGKALGAVGDADGGDDAEKERQRQRETGETGTERQRRGQGNRGGDREAKTGTERQRRGQGGRHRQGGG